MNQNSQAIRANLLPTIGYPPSQNLAALERLVLPDGKNFKVPSASQLEFSQDVISLFCHKHARYGFPTQELINFLKEEIGTDSAIEIGAGHGDTGRALGIPLTDSKMQELPEIKAYYESLNQPVIQYPADVEKLDALEAIEKYKPDVVIGSWVTHLWKPGMNQGNVYGVEERAFKGKINKYIHIGNSLTHSEKPILKIFNFSAISESWLYSRSLSKSRNVIYIFNCHSLKP